MRKELSFFVDGMYSAFSFSGRGSNINRRARSAKTYSSLVTTNTKQNFKNSMGSIARSVKNATA